MKATDFTSPQRKLLALLADGLPHPADDLFDLLFDHYDRCPDNLSSVAWGNPRRNLRAVICLLRKRLRPHQLDIAFVRRGRYDKSHYQLVALLTAKQQAQVRRASAN